LKKTTQPPVRPFPKQFENPTGENENNNIPSVRPFPKPNRKSIYFQKNNNIPSVRPFSKQFENPTGKM
jgi:hypothetical protein